MLPVLKKILNTLSDGRDLGNLRTDERTPLNDLIAAYKEMTEHDTTLEKFDQSWTGLSLKNAIGNMSDDQQQLMLANMASDGISIVADAWTYTEHPSVVEQRKNKTFLLRLIGVVISVAFLMVLGGIVALFLKSDFRPDETFIVKFFDTTAEVLKLLINVGAGGNQS